MYNIIPITIILFSIYFLITLEIKRERRLCKIKDIYIHTDKKIGKYDFLYVSDFHDTDNKMCLSCVESVCRYDTDIKDIISGGDMITYSPKRKTGLLYENFMKLLDIIKSYDKNFYYGYGNHENRLRLIRKKFKNDIDDLDSYERDIKNYDMHILDDTHVDIKKGVRLYEIALMIEYYKKNFSHKEISRRLTREKIYEHVGDIDKSYYNIILCHNPDYAENLIDYGFDLVLSGHIHGGLIRLPFIGPLFSPEATFLPPYNKGQYKYKDKDIVVSNGMGEHTIKIRLNNIPEVYKIHISEK
ncbi:MAG: metallophosphoesterase [Lachnospiraceae bacterium]|nr:metallophosphoesterase [Lachnospiraceae bacterium]